MPDRTTVTTWQQPDDLWAYRLEEPCRNSLCKNGTQFEWVDVDDNEQIRQSTGKPCDTCSGTGIVAYSQHGYRTRKLALVRAKQVIRERSLEPRRHEETIPLEAT